MKELAIPVDGERLPALVHRTRAAHAAVMVLHDTGLDRKAPGTRRLAAMMRAGGFATVQPELLDRIEAHERHNAIDVDLQSSRLIRIIDWLREQHWSNGLRLGLLAGDIGASVVLHAAAQRPREVGAVVCRDGRPDCCPSWIGRVLAPTLLLVERDEWPYRHVFDALRCEKELVVAPMGERPVADAACAWFRRYLL